ncbi:MAG: bifunctional UDP-N-acetylmuramoyl-tripeptide:D-alanyl-D-alanine ligase/alanine racemase, partial [Odoribacter sp.]|nr:bifunctional UDP-N-acetylmuramoyl-tripeptide:D-alanyl-D-alanine ligase/alanine racemase [Odoribacter sp.]
RPEYAAFGDANFFNVPDVLAALQQLAAWHRQQLQAEVIGITGSNGKTIVNEWLYQMLSDETGIYRSPRSYNSQLGVPLSLLGISRQTRLAIIEAGISLLGEMQRLQHMIRPDIGIFTHLGDAHGENFASSTQKLHEKAVLFQDCRYLIGQAGEAMDELLTVVSPARTLLWGEGENADIRILKNCPDEHGREITLDWQGQTYRFRIPFADTASFENCMNAVCILLLKGKSPEYVARKVEALQPIAMRMEIKNGINQCVLINDYYNSDAASFHLALNTLAMQDAGREKVVILSDFIGTGNEEKELYQEVARLLKEANVSLFIGIGETISRYKPCFLLPHCRFYQDTDSFLRQENRETFRNQVILIKGARKFRFEYIAGFLQKQSHTPVLEVDLA